MFLIYFLKIAVSCCAMASLIESLEERSYRDIGWRALTVFHAIITVIGIVALWML